MIIPLLLAALQVQALPTLLLANHQNVRLIQAYYTVELYLGSPPQRFTLLVDISTSYLQVDALQCADCNSTSRFHSSESVTFKSLKSLKTEKWAGELGLDWAAFGSKGGLMVENQIFLLNLKQAERSFREVDGIFVSC